MNLDDLDDRGRSALHLAAEEGKFDVAKVLIQKGADVNSGVCYTVLVLTSNTSLDALRICRYYKIVVIMLNKISIQQ